MLLNNDLIVETSTTRKKDWVLTQTAFDKLLAALDSDRERAGEKYENTRLKLVKFFEYRHSFSPEEHADEAINRAARKIDEGEEIQNLQSYIFGIARLLFLDSVKQQKKQVAIEDAPPLVQEPGFDKEDDADVQYACFQQCLQNLPPDNRELILEYYEDEKRGKIDRRRTLAERFSLPLNALRIRACRIRSKLEDCVSGCIDKKLGKVK